ncbi:MAG: CAP domain-containing protein [Myxococcota bacterium]
MRRGAYALALSLTGCLFGGDEAGDLLDEDPVKTVDRLVPTAPDAPDDAPPAAPRDVAGLDAHNTVRANAQPPPSPPLSPLEWDEQLAEVATSWARGCRFVHSEGTGFGENLYVASWAASLEEAVDSWASEDAFYDYADNSCSGVCGHYTQIVWRSTERVGCGFADCPVVEGVNFGGRLWVCNYDPPGNFVGQKPY